MKFAERKTNCAHNRFKLFFKAQKSLFNLIPPLKNGFVHILLHYITVIVSNILQQYSVHLHIKPLCPFFLWGSLALSAACQILDLPILHFGGLLTAYQESLCSGSPFMSCSYWILLQLISGIFVQVFFQVSVANMDYCSCTTLVDCEMVRHIL